MRITIRSPSVKGLLRARQSECREEPVCLRCSEGLVTVRARPSVLRRELVNENNKGKPVSL